MGTHAVEDLISEFARVEADLEKIRKLKISSFVP